MELRVHGIGSHRPHEVLGAPRLVAGDADNGVYELPANLRQGVRAFVWSRTTRKGLGAYRYFLLPFTLINVAGFMHAARDARDRGTPEFRALVHLLGASVTVSYIYWLWAILHDVPAILGAPGAWTALGGAVVPLGILGAILTQAVRVPRDGSQSDRSLGNVGDGRFWAKNAQRSLFVGHLVTTIAIMWCVPILSRLARADFLLTLAVLQLVSLIFVGGFIVFRGRDSRPSESGGVVALGLAVALPHVILGGLLLGAFQVGEAIVGSEPRIAHTFAINATAFWQFVPSFFIFSVAAWAVGLTVRALRHHGDLEADKAAARAAYRASSASEPAWFGRVLRMRDQALIRDMPGSMLARPLKLLMIIGFIAAVPVFGVILPDTTLLTALFTPLGQWWGILTLVVAIVVPLSVVFFFRSSHAQVRAAVLFDVLGFWPRRHHPLAPPPYAGITTERLRDVIATDGATELIGHSQGSVLAYTAMARSSERARAQTLLITCGSPLISLYAACFPAYFSAADFDDLRASTKEWFNLHRDTDPIATAIFQDGGDGDILLLEPEPGARLWGHSGYWEDKTMLEILKKSRSTGSLKTGRSDGLS